MNDMLHKKVPQIKKPMSEEIMYVLHDWIRNDETQESVYHTEEGIDLWMTQYHCGSCFTEEQLLEDKELLMGIIEQGYRPVFYLLFPKAENYKKVINSDLTNAGRND